MPKPIIEETEERHINAIIIDGDGIYLTCLLHLYSL